MRKLMMWGEKEKPTKKNTDRELKTLEEFMKEKEVKHEVQDTKR